MTHTGFWNPCHSLIKAQTVIDKLNNFDLLHPSAPPAKKTVKPKLWFNYEAYKTIKGHCVVLLAEMKYTFTAKQKSNSYHMQHIQKLDTVGAVWEHLEELATQQQLKWMGLEVFNKYKCVFEPIPHMDELLMDVYCWIQLKDAMKVITMWSYSSPHKYHEAWHTLIQHHEYAM